MAVSAATLMMRCLSLPKMYFLVITEAGPAMAIQTVPTGFSSVPPSGPAIPDIAIE